MLRKLYLIPMMLGLMTPLLSLSQPAEAQSKGEQYNTQFEVRMYGLPVGTLALAERTSDTRYAAAARFRTKGLASAMRKSAFEMKANGRVQGGALDPSSFEATVNTGSKDRSDAANFSTKDKRIDPLTALMIGAATRGPKEGCDEDVLVFDGKRTHRLTMQTQRVSAQKLICTGTFMREKGYSRAQIEKLDGYRFTAVYENRESGYVFTYGKASTLHGPVTIHRQ